MKFAAIDIGSNAVRLLLTRVFEDEEGKPRFKKMSLVRMPVRLGTDAFTRGEISPEKVQSLTETMIGFRHLINAFAPEDYMACATSAMREARNGPDIIDTIRRDSGIELQIIDGSREAEIIYSNHIAEYLDPGASYLYIDVGGGSTELTLFENTAPTNSHSFNIGTVRILEDLVDKQRWKDLKAWIKELTTETNARAAIGSGGNINKLFRMANQKEGTSLKYHRLRSLYKQLNNLTLEQRIIDLGLRPDRADVIVPAAKIYTSVMRWAGIREIYVPQIGLADGMVHLLYEKYINQNQ